METFAANAHDHPIATWRTEYHSKRHGMTLIADAILVPIQRRTITHVRTAVVDYRGLMELSVSIKRFG